MINRITEAFAGLWASFVRTLVPLVTGSLVGWLVSLGLPVDEEFKASLTLFVTVIFGAVYYLLIRVLERLVPKLGWLLGSVKQPVYALPAAVPAVESSAQIANANITTHPAK